MAALGDYLIAASDPKNPNKTLTEPQSVARRRTLAEAMMKEGMDSSPVVSPWQGAARLAQGLIGGYESGAANREEAAGRKSAQDAAAQLGSGSDNAALLAVANNPYSTSGMTDIAKAMYEARNKPHEQQAPLEIDRMLDAANIKDPAERRKYILDRLTDKTEHPMQVLKNADGDPVGLLDPRSGAVRPLQLPAGMSLGGAAGGTMPNGQPIPEPPAGVDRKAYRTEAAKTAADAATGKQTEEQAKSAAFATRMLEAERHLADVEKEGTSTRGRMLDSIPVIGNMAQTEGYQKFSTATNNFLTAQLRRESGAAIAPEEFNRYEKQFIPRIGDKPPQIEQKRQMRRLAIEEMVKSAGPGYTRPGGLAVTAPAAPGTGKTKTGVGWSVE